MTFGLRLKSRPRNSQPKSGASLVQAWNPAFAITVVDGELRDVVNSAHGTYPASVLSAKAAGQSIVFPSGSCYAALPTRGAYNLLGPLTLVWVGVIDTLAQYQFLIARAAGSGGTNNPFELRVNSGGGIQLLRANAGGYSTWATGQSPPVGRPCVLAATQGGNLASTEGSALWINGASYAVTPSYVTSGAATGNTEPLLLGTRGDTYTYMRGSCALAMGFPRVLSAGEIIDLTAQVSATWKAFAP